MKKLVLAAAMSAAGTAAFAGGYAEPIVEFVPAPVVVEETTTSSSAAGIVVPLLLLAIIAAAAAD